MKYIDVSMLSTVVFSVVMIACITFVAYGVSTDCQDTAIYVFCKSD